MIIVSIEPLCVELVDFDPKRRIADFRLHFNDGIDRTLTFKQTIDNPAELAERVLRELKQFSKREAIKMDAQSADIVTVRFLREDEVEIRLRSFFEKVKDRMRAVLNLKLAEGYLDKLYAAKKLVVEL